MRRPLDSSKTGGQRAARKPTFLASIAAARQEAQTLFELSQDLGRLAQSRRNPLRLLSEAASGWFPTTPSPFMCGRTTCCIPQHVSGDNFRLFESLRIPLGQGLSGWVAQNRKPIINGNPSVEPGYLNDPTKFSTLRSALALAAGRTERRGRRIALYQSQADAFTSDHLRILLAVTSKMALAIENALKYQQAENSATTDFLTDLPNARSLFLELDRELARCKREETSLTVMVCDMDGFKQINDRFGHLEGNRVLRLFAQALKTVLPRVRLCGPHGRRRIRGDCSGSGGRLRPLRKPTSCAIWRGRSDRKFARKTSCRSAWAAPCIRRTDWTLKNCSRKPTGACISRSSNSPAARTAACIHA